MELIHYKHVHASLPSKFYDLKDFSQQIIRLSFSYSSAKIQKLYKFSNPLRNSKIDKSYYHLAITVCITSCLYASQLILS